MSVAIVFTVAAAAVAATLGDEPELAIAAEPAANVLAKEPAVSPDLPIEPPVAYVEHLERKPRVANARAEPETLGPKVVKPEVVKPEVVKPEVPRPRLGPEPRREPPREPQPGLGAEPSPEREPQPEPAPRPKLEAEPDPHPPDPHPASRPERERIPEVLARADAPGPAREERRKDSALLPPELPAGAIMSLTIEALGIHGAPVRSSGSERALDRGVIHEPDTSLPWDEGAQRNVYLAGHRLGWRGTGSYRIFYNLDKLRRGDEILLKDSRGRTYEYRVTGSFLVGPNESWVKDAVPGRDMMSLQTCTPIPTFEKRLIVRANRV